MGTMGESTRRRMAAVVQSAQGLGATVGAREGLGRGPTVGGYGGGLGGTWGKAPTGRSTSQRAERGPGGVPDAPLRPTGSARQLGGADGGVAGAAKALSRKDLSPGLPGGTGHRPGVRERIRPASAAVKNVWDTMPSDNVKHSPAKNRTPPLGAARVPGGARRPHTARARTDGPVALDADLRGPSAPPPADPATAGLPSLPPPHARRRAASHLERVPARPNAVEARRRARAAPDGPAPLGAAAHDARAPGAAPAAAAAAGLSALHLQNLEEEIRGALRTQRSVYEDEKALLLKTFSATDSQGDGQVDIEDLENICKRLGVSVSREEAAALFEKNGFRDAMPYAQFAAILLANPLQRLADTQTVRRGAFVAGQRADFYGKIVYPPCHTGVFVPSDWDPTLAERSAQLPPTRLRLEYVYGFDGMSCTGNNLWYGPDDNTSVWFSAGVGIVYERQQHRQRFFLGHSDDIKCLDVLQCPVALDGVEYAGRTIAATGQVSHVDDGPYVCVWDTRVGSQDGENLLRKISLPKSSRGVNCVAFSPCGRFLAVVAMDNQHTVQVYDWASGSLLSEGKGFSGEPPQVFGVAWDPFHEDVGMPPRFVTYGRKHVKMWVLSEAAGAGGEVAVSARLMSFGGQKMQNATSCAFLPPAVGGGGEALAVTGMADGTLYAWRGGKCVRALDAHAAGPKQNLNDGSRATVGVRGLRLAYVGSKWVLYSGGADGVVHRWDVSDGTIRDGRMAGPPIRVRPPYGAPGAQPPIIKALDVDSTGRTLLVGTADCDVFEVTDATQDIFVDGHEGDLWAVACHPARPDVFVSAAASKSVFLWSASQRRVLRIANLPFKARSAAVCPAALDGAHHIAVGGMDGNIAVMADADLRPIAQLRDTHREAAVVRYSPCGSYLAVGTQDCHVDVYAVKAAYKRIARCSGHSSAITALDFSADGSVLQSTSQAYELLYFNPRTGKQVLHPQRDTQWATWTCPLGFPVMGIWPEGADGTDVNSVCRSRAGDLVATAGDDGFVSLYNYPCVVEEAACRAYRGHSSHVMCVDFACDDTRVLSAGGKDRSIFQFAVQPVEPEPEPEPAPEPVWGPMDPEGKQYGWITPPAHGAGGVSEGEASPSRAPKPPLPPRVPSAKLGAPGGPRDAPHQGGGVTQTCCQGPCRRPSTRRAGTTGAPRRTSARCWRTGPRWPRRLRSSRGRRAAPTLARVVRGGCLVRARRRGRPRRAARTSWCTRARARSRPWGVRARGRRWRGTLVQLRATRSTVTRRGRKSSGGTRGRSTTSRGRAGTSTTTWTAAGGPRRKETPRTRL
ncbi:unnamed protein product [Pedinophyceae sp. YPF-701]|nr:unnamed protein product [Pedinophyceae sp. YPF-701]